MALSIDDIVNCRDIFFYHIPLINSATYGWYFVCFLPGDVFLQIYHFVRNFFVRRSLHSRKTIIPWTVVLRLRKWQVSQFLNRMSTKVHANQQSNRELKTIEAMGFKTSNIALNITWKGKFLRIKTLDIGIRGSSYPFAVRGLGLTPWGTCGLLWMTSCVLNCQGDAG